MSFQTFVTERLAAITATLNAISTNAKKIDELPVQELLNSFSKIHVSNNGISESLSIQKIIDVILDNTTNQIISIGEITLVANNLTIPLNAQWLINGVNYNTTSDTVINIPYAETELTRTDILVANTLSQIIRISGIETAGIAVRPNIPTDTILVTEINVTDSSVGDPTPPITGDAFRSKIEKGEIVWNIDPYNGYVKIDTKASYRFGDALLTFYGLINSSTNLYDGREFTFKNNGISNITIKHNTGFPARILFWFNNELDYILKPKELIKVKYSAVSGFLEFINTSEVPTTSTPVFSTFQLIQKGYGNSNSTPEIGDIYCGWKDVTERWSEAKLINYIDISSLDDYNNFEPIIINSF